MDAPDGCCLQERFDDVFSQASYLAYHPALDHIRGRK